jgi:hypothetical protein
MIGKSIEKNDSAEPEALQQRRAAGGLRAMRKLRTRTNTLQRLARERARELQKPITRQQPTHAGQRSGKQSKMHLSGAEPKSLPKPAIEPKIL